MRLGLRPRFQRQSFTRQSISVPVSVSVPDSPSIRPRALKAPRLKIFLHLRVSAFKMGGRAAICVYLRDLRFLLVKSWREVVRSRRGQEQGRRQRQGQRQDQRQGLRHQSAAGTAAAARSVAAIPSKIHDAKAVISSEAEGRVEKSVECCRQQCSNSLPADLS